MDSVIEYLVEKDKEVKDIMGKTLLFIGILILCLASLYFLGSFGLFGAALIVYFGLKVQDRFSVEYEYCILNADIDIDRIFGKKRRKRLLSIEGGSIDIVAPANSTEAKDAMNGKEKKIYACKNRNNENNYVVVGYTTKGGRVAIYIENEQKITEQLRKYIPRKVIL